MRNVNTTVHVEERMDTVFSILRIFPATVFTRYTEETMLLMNIWDL